MTRKLLESRITCGYCKDTISFLSDYGMCPVCGKFPQFRYLLPGDSACVFEDGKLVAHRPWFKVIFNPILRKIQFWTKNPRVIVSLVEDIKPGDHPSNKVLLGYSFQRQL